MACVFQFAANVLIDVARVHCRFKRRSRFLAGILVAAVAFGDSDGTVLPPTLRLCFSTYVHI